MGAIVAHRGGIGEFAVGLAGADLPVLPLLPRTKQPRYAGGYKGATCDAEWIAQHWAAHRDDNVGVRPPIGMVVLDIDPRHGGDAAMRTLVRRWGALPKTWVARTGGGGWHYWWTVGETALRSHLAAGVDVKTGANGFVVAPPSVTAFVYQWLSPPIGDPAPAPDWLREALRPPPAYRGAAQLAMPEPRQRRYSLHCLVARITRAPVGRRHNTVRGAFTDAAKQGDLAAFKPALSAAALAADRTPGEIDAIIAYAHRQS